MLEHIVHAILNKKVLGASRRTSRPGDDGRSIRYLILCVCQDKAKSKTANPKPKPQNSRVQGPRCPDGRFMLCLSLTILWDQEKQDILEAIKK